MNTGWFTQLKKTQLPFMPAVIIMVVELFQSRLKIFRRLFLGFPDVRKFGLSRTVHRHQVGCQSN